MSLVLIFGIAAASVGAVIGIIALLAVAAHAQMFGMLRRSRKRRGDAVF